jgi:hypothetical protein
MSDPRPDDPLRTCDPVAGPLAGPADTLTPSAPTTGPGAETDRLSVPGYEILGKLGQGGFGVVYQARQLAADRVVALKMILHGGHAGDDTRERFRTEAQAIARLQHPHIVQVFEVGEHDGLPFFSLEYCPGGSLAQKLAGTPLPPKEAAGLVETLARAMDAAHREHIIHRDLKPANVLLAADGTAKVTDFGLAKQLNAAAGPTLSNAVLGTPSYMAPEQAHGKGALVGPAADTYALGAILYECLVGRPPFKAATTWETLAQVLNDEPVPPRQLQSAVPRDLETICLKCLRKEPARRYASAAALAEDLRRYQAGEPITARPVSRYERAVKWVRRKPAAAALIAVSSAALVALFLTIGAYSLTERRLREEADKAREEAENKTTAADRARQEANAQTAAAVQAREQTEETLARSLLRPLGHAEGQLNDIELDALWELAESPSDRVRRLFLAHAIERPSTARQLRNRRELAVHAALGLDPARRRQFEEVVLARLRAAGTKPDLRMDCAFVALGIARPGRAITAEMAAVITSALAKESNFLTRAELATALAVVAARMDPAQAAQAAGRLTDALGKQSNAFARADLAKAVAVVAARMVPAQAARQSAAAARVLASALATETNPDALANLSAALAAVAAHLEPAQAARHCAEAALRLSRTLASETKASAQAKLAEALAKVAARMEPAQAARRGAEAGRLLSRTLATETDPSARNALAKAVAVVAAHMRPAEAARCAAEVSQVLTGALAKEKYAHARFTLATALAVVAPHLGPAQAAEAVHGLTDAIAQETDPFVSSDLAGALAAAAARLEPAQAAQAARRLTAALARQTSIYARSKLAEAVAAVVARLEPAEAAQVAASLTRALGRERDAGARSTLAQAVGAVAARLGPAEAGQVVRQLTEALARETSASTRADLVTALAAVAARLKPAQARLAARRLTVAVPKEKEPEAQSDLALALAAVVGRMEPAQAARGSAAAARWLTDALASQTSAPTQADLAAAAAAVQARMHPDEMTEAIRRGRRARSETRFVRPELALALVAVARHLGPNEAAEAARRLTDALANQASDSAQAALARALAALAARMEPAQAARQCAEAASLFTDKLASQRFSFDALTGLGIELYPIGQHSLLDSLRLVSTQLGYEGINARAVLAAQAAAAWMSPSPDPGSFVTLTRAAQPLPCRLTTQQLVDVLKRPTCVGAARELILELLGQRYQRRFHDVWEFADYAHDHLPDIDLKSPPRRKGK